MLAQEFQRWEIIISPVRVERHVFLTCPIRKKNICDGPEERIRQGLLHFLIYTRSSNNLPLDISAERKQHDIALWREKDPKFNPRPSPLLIVETKMDHLASEQTNEQLLRYLGETNCDLGIVFTGARMWRIEKSQDWASVTMNSLSELREIICEKAKVDPLAKWRSDFNAACAGELEALRRLVVKFQYETFVLLTSKRKIACRALRFHKDSIDYLPAELYTGQRSSLKAEGFQLLSIEP